jgi:hypothetical protein
VYCNDGTVASPGSPYFGIGIPNRVHKIIVLDCSSGTPSASVVDLSVQDANIVCISQRGRPQDIIASSTHLFVPCNYTSSDLTSANNPGQGERPYLARLDHGTLAAAGGKFIDELIYPGSRLNVLNGKYLDGKLYLVMLGENYDGRVVIVDEDLSPSSAALYPPQGVIFPTNDNFGSALALTAGASAGGNLFYASMETGEPIPSWAWDGSSPSPTTDQVYTWARNNGHSVWYSFQAPATHAYTISVADSNGGSAHSIEVYTGAAVGSLTPVIATFPTFTGSPTTASLSATAGVTYMIAVRHDTTNGFADFAGGVLSNDLERLGRYTITIT